MDIKLKDKIQKALDSDFIGEVNFSNEEIEQMYIDCRYVLERVKETKMHNVNTFTEKDSKTYIEKEKLKCPGELVICFICAIKNLMNNPKFDETVFYNTITQEIFNEPVPQSLFYSVFKETFEKHNKKIFISKGGVTRYRESLLAQALMPYNSTYDFIKLLYSWYTDSTILNFEYKNKKLLDKICKYLYDEFSADVEKSDDKIIFGGTYNITASFRYIFTQDLESGRKLIDYILRNINQYFNECEVDKSNYINKILEDVLEKTNLKDVKKTRYKEKIINDYSKIKAEYRLSDNNELILFVSRIISIDSLKTDVDYIVQSGDKEIKERKKVKGNEITAYIDEHTFKIKNISPNINDITFKIIMHRGDNEVEIYNSKDTLFRKYVFFTKNKKEVNKEFYKAEREYYFYGTYANFSVKDCELINNNVYLLLPENNEYIDINKTRIYFSDKPRIGARLHGTLKFASIRDIKLSKFVYGDTEYDIYESVNDITIEKSENFDIKSTKIKIDDTIQNLEDVCMTVNDEYKIFLSKHNENGKHVISIYNDTERTDIYYYINNNFELPKGFFRKILSNKIYKFYYVLNGVEYVEDILPSQENLRIDMDGGFMSFDFCYIKWKLSTEEDFHYVVMPKLVMYHKNELLGNFNIEIETNTSVPYKILVNNKPAIYKNGHFEVMSLLEDAKNEGKIRTDIVLSINNDKFTPDIVNIWNKPFIKKSFNLDLDNLFFNLNKYTFLDKDSKLVITADELTKPLIISEKGELSHKIKDGFYNNVKVFELNWLGEMNFIQDFNFRYFGNFKKTLFNDKNILLRFNGRIGGIKLKQNYLYTNIKYLSEKQEGDLIATEYSALCDTKEVFFNMYIPKDARYNFFINKSFIADMRNIDDMIEDKEDRIIVAFYKDEKEDINEDSIYHYSIIKTTRRY